MSSFNHCSSSNSSTSPPSIQGTRPRDQQRALAFNPWGYGPTYPYGSYPTLVPDSSTYISYDTVNLGHGQDLGPSEHGFLQAQTLARGGLHPYFGYPLTLQPHQALPIHWSPRIPPPGPHGARPRPSLGGFGRECKFCKNNGETLELYRSHILRNPTTGKLICPVLRGHHCEVCGDTGDDAHTKNYCPKVKEKLRQALPLHLKRTPRQSDGHYR